MNKDSFNLMLTNLAIGLVKGHPYLRPTSKKVKALGYRLFCVERSLFCAAANSSKMPELVFYSPKQDHAVICEWTKVSLETDDSDPRKVQQIQSFLSYSKEDLVDRAGMPIPGGAQNSVWLIVTPENLASFEGSITEALERAMLCSFQISGDGGCVSYHQGTFQDEKLADIFKDGISASRIPMGFIPISLDHFSQHKFAELLIQQIVTYIVKHTTEFSNENIGQAIFGEQWPLLGKEKQKGVRQHAAKTLKQLAQKPYLQEWLTRTESQDLTWRVAIPKGKESPASLIKLQSRAQKYMHEKFSGPNSPTYQYDLFDQPEPVDVESE